MAFTKLNYNLLVIDKVVLLSAIYFIIIHTLYTTAFHKHNLYSAINFKNKNNYLIHMS